MIIFKKIIQIVLGSFHKTVKIKSLPEDIVTVKNITDPLVPYFKSYNSKYSDINSEEIFYRSYNVPMSHEQYKEIFEATINKERFIDNKDNATVLENIYKDMKQVYEKVKILRKLNINLSIDLTGGAARDFVLGHADNITDLDIMISFNNEKDVDYVDEDKFKSKFLQTRCTDLIKAGFKFKDLQRVDWIDGEKDSNVMQMKLTQLCFSNDEIENIFINTEQKRQDFKDLIGPDGQVYTKVYKERLCGVMKINLNKSNYKIDLLLTDMNKPTFMDNFDINLCKASFCFVNDKFLKSFPEKSTHLISRFSASVDFFADVLNKKMTINVNERSNNMLDLTIEKHLPKLKVKYPEYDINFSITSARGSEEALKYAKIKIYQNKINEMLSEKKKSFIKNKI